MPMDKYPRVANYRCNPDCIIAKMNLIKSSVRGLCSDARPWLRARCQRTLPKTPEEDPGGTSTRNPKPVGKSAMHLFVLFE